MSEAVMPSSGIPRASLRTGQRFRSASEGAFFSEDRHQSMVGQGGRVDFLSKKMYK
jgi:hypothetical protein